MLTDIHFSSGLKCYLRHGGMIQRTPAPLHPFRLIHRQKLVLDASAWPPSAENTVLIVSQVVPLYALWRNDESMRTTAHGSKTAKPDRFT